MHAPAASYASEILGDSYRPTDVAPRVQPHVSKQTERNETRHLPELPSPLAQRHRPEEVEVSSLEIGRTSEHSSAGLQEREVARRVSSALVVDFGHYRSTHKVIAQKAGVSPETVKKWIAADSAPSLIYFLRLLPHSPALRQLVSMESELSPDFQRELASLIQRHIR